MFKKWPMKMLKGMIYYIKEEEILKGEMLFREGEPADGICFLYEGQLQIQKTLPLRPAQGET